MDENQLDPVGPKPQHFDVVCAGESFWKAGHNTPSGPGLRPGGGAVSVALALAAKGLSVGLATVLSADALGRKARLVLKGAGVDTSGVVLAQDHGEPWRTSVRHEVRGERHDGEAALGVPAGWSAPTLVLSGLSPLLLQASALCRAARAARRAGALSLIDFNANRSVWNGRDARNILMVLREVDVARASIADLAVLGMDLRQVRSALRPDAVLVMTDHHGRSIAMGPFGEVSVPRKGPPPKARGAGDSFTAALCTELSRRDDVDESPVSTWHRALRNSHQAALATM
jgi:2-dehydro-3-deoxygluconokinase